MEIRSGVGDMGDVFVLFLAVVLQTMRDRLNVDGYPSAADLLQTMVIECDDYLQQKFGGE